MKRLAEIAITAIITIVIGGVAYNVSKSDIVNNFAKNTVLSQKQAEEYVDKISEDDLFSWSEIGQSFVKSAQDIGNVANEIDCVNYKYDWEKPTLSCFEGKTQMNKLAQDEKLLGQLYIKLGSDSASKEDIRKTIYAIEQLNSDFQLKIIGVLIDDLTLDEMIKENLYNKSVLEAVLNSEEK